MILFISSSGGLGLLQFEVFRRDEIEFCEVSFDYFLGGYCSLNEGPEYSFALFSSERGIFSVLVVSSVLCSDPNVVNLLSLWCSSCSLCNHCYWVSFRLLVVDVSSVLYVRVD